MSEAVDPTIFKAYDIRGLYGSRSTPATATSIGRSFARVIAELEGKPTSELRLGLGHDMRLTAPELAAAYRDGMCAEGATVLDAGEVGTEMLYYLVGSRGLDGGLMCTASHNPKAYTGVKLVKRRRDRAVGRRRDRRRPGRIEAGLGEAPGGGTVEEVAIIDEFHDAALRFIDPEAVRPLKVVVDGGNGMAGPMIGPLLERLGLDLVEAYWDARRQLPRPRAQPAAAREPRVHHARGGRARAPTSGSPGTGTPTAASSSTTQGAFVDGDFLTALLAESILDKHPGATVLYDVRASRAVADAVHAAGGRALMNRVGHAFFKTRMRDEHAAFGGEVSGHYYFHDFYCADSGTIPALLILELLSLRPGADVRAARALPVALLHLRRDQLRGRGSGWQARGARRGATPTAVSTARRDLASTTTTGTSTSARRTPSRCCGCASNRCAPARTWSATATRCSA